LFLPTVCLGEATAPLLDLPYQQPGTASAQELLALLPLPTDLGVHPEHGGSSYHDATDAARPPGESGDVLGSEDALAPPAGPAPDCRVPRDESATTLAFHRAAAQFHREAASFHDAAFRGSIGPAPAALLIGYEPDSAQTARHAAARIAQVSLWNAVRQHCQDLEDLAQERFAAASDIP
jgi:hypothetical protein